MRGINKQQIFEDDKDCQKFLELLQIYKEKCELEIYAYCLMGNHLHLLLKEGSEDIGHSIKRIALSYVYWFNWKYQRSGHLFQDRFKSEPVQTDEYLLTVIRYIHQNPIVAGLCTTPEHYPYSSYSKYSHQANGDLVDWEQALELLDRHDIVSEKSEEPASCLDVGPSFRIADKTAQDLIMQLSQCTNASEFQALDKPTRNRYLAQLKKEGLSIRQLSRLTGISFGVIRKIS
jgi:REP element-mobilizing transposase RayT